MAHWAGNYEVRMEVNGRCVTSGVSDTIEEALSFKDACTNNLKDAGYTETQYTRYKVCLKKDNNRARVIVTELTVKP